MKRGNIKAVICEETGIVYESQTAAARDTGIPQGNISRCCTGDLQSAGGYHWHFYIEKELEVIGNDAILA